MTDERAAEILDRDEVFASTREIREACYIGRAALLEKMARETTGTQRTAHWNGTSDGYADGLPVHDYWECSECGAGFESEPEPPDFNYCPNCGAKMEKEQKP